MNVILPVLSVVEKKVESHKIKQRTQDIFPARDIGDTIGVYRVERKQGSREQGDPVVYY